MKEKQKNIDHLAIIVSNYVAMNDIEADSLDVLEKIFEKLHVSSNIEKWWKNRFAVARANLMKGGSNG